MATQQHYAGRMNRALEVQPDRMLNTAEAARVLGLSPVTLRQWRRRSVPKGPDYFRLGRTTVRYRQSEVVAWLERHAVSSEE